MAKKFFYVCVVLLGLGAMVRVAQAQTVTLSTLEYMDSNSTDPVRIGAYGPLQGCTSPSQLVFGTLPNGAPVTEIIVQQHILQPGQTIPLPRYADGTEASESEIFWTAQLWEARYAHWQPRYNFPAFGTSGGDRTTISFSGRTYVGGYAYINPYNTPLLQTNDVAVAVTVVASRRAGATSTNQSTWGSVKVQSR